MSLVALKNICFCSPCTKLNDGGVIDTDAFGGFSNISMLTKLGGADPSPSNATAKESLVSASCKKGTCMRDSAGPINVNVSGIATTGGMVVVVVTI